MIGKPQGKKGMLPVWVYDPSKKSGKRYVGRAATIEDARKLELQAKLDVLNDTHAAKPAKMTIDAFAAIWLEDHHGENTKRPEPTTKRQNEQNLRAFRKEHGKLLLTKVDRGLALATARDKPHHAKTVAAMFATAYDLQLIPTNPFARLGIRPGDGRRDITPLTLDEIDRLCLLAVDAKVGLGGYGARFAAFITFAAWTGLRPGEMCALTWNQIDWNARELRVDAKHGTRRNDGTLGPPKGRGKKRGRFVPLSDEAVSALETLPRTGKYVFLSPTRKPIRPNSLRTWWIPVRTAFTAQLPANHWLPLRLSADPTDNLDVYELRHHFGSMLADRGMSARDIAELMGNTEKVCSDIYLHTYEDRLRDRTRAAFGQNVRDLRPAKEQAS